MLPCGVLSKHGYTTRFGFFEGVCMGAGHQPFELDISLIERAIKAAQERAVELREQAAARKDLADPNNVVVNIWVTGTYRERGHYQTYKGRIERRGKTWKGDSGTEYGQAWFVYQIGSTAHEYDLHDAAPLADVAKKHNNQEVWRLEQMASQADQYVEWQTARIKDWKPQPLIERKDKA